MIMNCATITLTFIIKYFQPFHIFFLKKKTLWVEISHLFSCKENTCIWLIVTVVGLFVFSLFKNFCQFF